jgi:hypothetical protein
MKKIAKPIRIRRLSVKKEQEAKAKALIKQVYEE